MKLRLIIITTFLSIHAVSCDNKTLQEPELNVSDINLYAFGKNISWELNDSISVFDGISNLLYLAQTDSDTAKFLSATPLDESVVDLFAMYPSSKTAYRTESGLVLTMPADQEVTSDAMNLSSCIHVAYENNLEGSTYLKFKELCSYIRFCIDSDASVNSIMFSGNKDEFLAGDVEVTYSNKEPQISIVNGSNNVSVHSQKGLSGTYQVCLLPAVLQNGLKVTFIKADGARLEKKIVAQKNDGVESALVLVRARVNRDVIDFGNPFGTTSDDSTGDDGSTDDPSIDNPGADDSGTDNPGTDNPETDNPGTDDPGTDNPETDDPGTDDPGTDNPGTDDPETDKPSDDSTPEIGSSIEGYYVVIQNDLWN